MALDITLTLAKPDAVRQHVVGKIISRFEERGLVLIDIAWRYATESMIRLMYEDKATRPFFPELLDFMLSGPCIAMAWQGENAIARGRQVIGEKNPLDSDAGSIRGALNAEDRIRTLVHGSRSPEEAEMELRIWFPDRWTGPVTPAADRPANTAPKLLQDWYGEREEELVKW